MRSSGPATEGVLLEYVSANLILNGKGIELEELQERMKAMGCVSPLWTLLLPGRFALSVSGSLTRSRHRNPFWVFQRGSRERPVRIFSPPP